MTCKILVIGKLHAVVEGESLEDVLDVVEFLAQYLSDYGSSLIGGLGQKALA